MFKKKLQHISELNKGEAKKEKSLIETKRERRFLTLFTISTRNITLNKTCRNL
jgi:hypothetical protein